MASSKQIWIPLAAAPGYLPKFISNHEYLQDVLHFAFGWFAQEEFPSIFSLSHSVIHHNNITIIDSKNTPTIIIMITHTLLSSEWFGLFLLKLKIADIVCSNIVVDNTKSINGIEGLQGTVIDSIKDVGLLVWVVVGYTNPWL